MEGIGGCISWYGNWLLAHPQGEQILNHVFYDLKPSVLRLRNTYHQGSDFGGPSWQTSQELLEETASIVQSAKSHMNEDMPRILMCSWSPPIYMKASNSLHGNTGADSLAKDEYGVFRYKDFAKYWVDSLRAYEASMSLFNDAANTIESEP